MKRFELMAGVALVVLAGAAGCAVPSSQSSAPSSGKGAADPSRVQADETECAAYADARPSDLRYASYVSCFISRGYPTYVSLTKYGSVTGLTVRAERGQNTDKVVADLTTCAALEDTQVDVPPSTRLYMGLPTMMPARATYQIPFAHCVARLGYTTMDGDKPLAGAGVRPIATPAAPVAPPAPIAVPPAASVTPPPPVAVPPAAPASPPAPVVPAPARPAPPAVAAVASATRRPPLGAVTLGLNVDPYSSPPVVIVVVSKTPASNAGVRPGDVVLTLDEIPIASHRDIIKVLDTKRAGDLLKIDVQRGRQRLTLEATLAAR